MNTFGRLVPIKERKESFSGCPMANLSPLRIGMQENQIILCKSPKAKHFISIHTLKKNCCISYCMKLFYVILFFPYLRYEDGEEEHCLEMWDRDGKGLKWNDTPCSFSTFFICEA